MSLFLCYKLCMLIYLCKLLCRVILVDIFAHSSILLLNLAKLNLQTSMTEILFAVPGFHEASCKVFVSVMCFSLTYLT